MSSLPADRQVNTDQHLTGESPTAGASRPGLADRVFGRRRNYLIDPAYQIRTAVIAVLGMTFVVGVAAGLLHLLRSQQVAPALAEGPPIARGLAGDSGWAVFLVVAGVALVGAVFVIEILETHKTAGVVLRVSRGLQGLRDGAWGTRINLRKHDNFKEMEQAFNASARALCTRAEEEIRVLADIEGRLEHLVHAMETGDRAGGEELLRQLRGELGMMRDRHHGSLRAAPDVRFQAKI